MIRGIWWLMGYPDELLENADPRQAHLKHLMCRQIEKSSGILLKKTKHRARGKKSVSFRRESHK